MPYKNPEDKVAQRKRYYLKNREKILEQTAMWLLDYFEILRRY